jgi:hypothetical protein
MLLCRGGQPDTISIELGVSYISFKLYIWSLAFQSFSVAGIEKFPVRHDGDYTILPVSIGSCLSLWLRSSCIQYLLPSTAKLPRALDGWSHVELESI